MHSASQRRNGSVHIIFRTNSASDHAAGEQKVHHHCGNSGIGLATTRLFVAEGARVGITGRNKKTLDAVAEAFGTSVLAIQADVADVAATEQAIATIAKT